MKRVKLNFGRWQHWLKKKKKKTEISRLKKCKKRRTRARKGILKINVISGPWA